MCRLVVIRKPLARTNLSSRKRKGDTGEVEASNLKWFLEGGATVFVIVAYALLDMSN